MRWVLACTKAMEREKCGETKELLKIQSTPSHLEIVSWACMAATETGSLVFTDDVTADGSRVNFEVCRHISKFIGWHFTLQQVNDLKPLFKAKNWNVLDWPSQSPVLNPIEHAFHLLKMRLKANHASEDGHNTGLMEHHQGRYPASRDVFPLQTLGSHRIGFANKYWLSDFISYFSFVQLLLFPQLRRL